MGWKNRARDRQNEKSQMASKSFKLQVGDNVIRILPDPTDIENGKPYYEGYVHRNVGPDKRLVTCGKDIHGKGKCYICDKEIPKLIKSGRDSKLERAKLMEPVPNFVVQVAWLDLKSERMLGPKPWYVPVGKSSKSLDNKVLTLLFSPRRSYEHPKKGYNISINRTGTGFKDTRYGIPEPDDEPTPVPKEIMRKLKPLKEVIHKYSKTEQLAALYGEKYEKGEDEEMAVAKKKAAKKNAKETKKKKAASGSASGSSSASQSGSNSSSASQSGSRSASSGSGSASDEPKGKKKKVAKSSGSGSASGSGSNSSGSGSASKSSGSGSGSGGSGSASASGSASSGSGSASSSASDEPKSKKKKK